MKSHEAVDSEADDRLFLGGGDEPGELGGGDEPGELGFGDESGDEEEDTAIADDDEAEAEEPGDHGQLISVQDPSVQDPTTNDESTEEPTLEQLEQLTAEIEADGMETVEQLNRLRGTESRERMIIRASEHVRMAQVQRLLYVLFVHKARADRLANKPHSESSYTFVVDYGQNMALPAFHKEQPGCAYYYSPLNIYNGGVVDQAFLDENGQITNLLYAHVYHEGEGKKGANNVVSLVNKTLLLKNLLRAGDPGKELNIIYDNCSGQNKNNNVLKFAIWLTEMGFFNEVNFVFLIVGHTKNAADRLFNCLKVQYRRQNIYTMDQLLHVLDDSPKVSVHQATASDFFDWDLYLNLFYSDFKKAGSGGLIKKHHIFSCNYEKDRHKNTLHVNMRESDLPEHKVTVHKAFKQGFYGRSAFPKGVVGLQAAIAARKASMTAAMSDKLKQIVSDGINIFKRVELATKWARIIPQLHANDVFYQMPPKAILDAVKREKILRKDAKLEINAGKN